MKQKNMVLIGVAVGFGLLAALLATQMNAQPPQDAVTTVKLPVAKIEILIDEQFVKEEMPNMIDWVDYRKDAIPPGDWATTEEELIDKRVARTFHKGELFNKQDIAIRPRIEIPPGYHLYAIPINRTQLAGGWALPGSTVDILATMRSTKMKKSLTFPFLQNVLIVAVDTRAKMNQNESAVAGVTDVSFAITKEQSRLIKAAQAAGAAFSLVLLGKTQAADGKPIEDYEFKPSRDEVWQLLTDEYGKNSTDADDTKPDSTPYVTVELPVPKENLPAGTELTKELIETKFTTLKIEPPAPENVIRNIREHEGRKLVKELTANQFVPLNFIADSLPQTTPKVEVTAGPPPVFHDVIINTPSGVKKVRYQKMPNGKYKYLGELKVEDDVDAGAAKDKPETEAKPAPEVKVKPANEPKVARRPKANDDDAGPQDAAQ